MSSSLMFEAAAGTSANSATSVTSTASATPATATGAAGGPQLHIAGASGRAADRPDPLFWR